MNANNTHFNTYLLTHFCWLVKIHMNSTKLCGSYLNLVGLMWILTNQRECVKKYVLEGVCITSISQSKDAHV